MLFSLNHIICIMLFLLLAKRIEIYIVCGKKMNERFVLACMPNIITVKLLNTALINTAYFS